MANGTSNERGQYGRSAPSEAGSITGAPALAIGVAALLLAPVVAIVVGGAAALGGGAVRRSA